MNEEKRTRKVGTITMGLSLIVTGLIILLFFFKPNFNIAVILKFAPLILVFLGIEILINYFIKKNEPIKYDLFSMFICFLLICASLALSVVPVIFKYYGPETYEKRETLKKETYNSCYDVLSENKYIETLHIEIYRNSPFIELNHEIFLNIHLINLTGDKDEFANTCFEITQKLKTLNKDFENIRFSFSNENVELTLNLDGKFKQNMDIASLKKLIDENRFDIPDEMTLIVE